MKYVHLAVHVKSSSSHVWNTPQPCRQSTKLRIMPISIKIKIAIKIGATVLEMEHLKHTCFSTFHVAMHVHAMKATFLHVICMKYYCHARVMTGSCEPGTHCLRMCQNSQKSWEFGFFRKISLILLRVVKLSRDTTVYFNSTAICRTHWCLPSRKHSALTTFVLVRLQSQLEARDKNET